MSRRATEQISSHNATLKGSYEEVGASIEATQTKTSELDKMSEQQKANQTSEYRVLNQAGVSLFDHFLTQSDELWVLFIERCTATHAVTQTPEFSFLVHLAPASRYARLTFILPFSCADVNRVWCVYELAYWLRLMKKDKRRKIKLIPVDRNARLFRGLPTFQYVSTVFLILYAGGIGLACTMYNKACDPNDPTMPAHSRQY